MAIERRSVDAITSPQTLLSKWEDTAVDSSSQSALLLYRSNLLGSDRRITNFGGGNTSAKTVELDPLSRNEVEVLWVKGSGGDVGTMHIQGFATLYMDKLRAIKGLYRGLEHEDEMVDLLPHATWSLNPRAASIDTPLHAFVPARHVDHMHPDAIIAIAASSDSRALTQQIFGSEIGWLPWRRPGFELGLMLERFCRENPDAKGVVLEAHGLFTWADDAKDCYELTLATINKAAAWLSAQDVPAFGGPVRPVLPGEERRTIAAAIMPCLRGLVSSDRHMVGHFDDQEAVLEFVAARDMARLAALGTSCPDHFLRTKIAPLVVPFEGDLVTTLAGLPEAVGCYRRAYAEYYDRCKRADSPPMRDPNPVVFLIPGVGMVTFAADKATARISAEFYVNAINVMRGAEAVSTYRGLPEREAFDIEYWQLEEAKLQRMPPPRSLSGRVAFVTGGAGGIGLATAHRHLSEGACVVLADISQEALESAEAALVEDFSSDVVRSIRMDVTDEHAVVAAMDHAAVEYGGIDILVSNAGIASSAPIAETTLALWNRNMAILATGYFLVSREAYRVMTAQGIGGAIAFVASKNGLAASPNAAAYCTAKAAEIHLARCLALEGAAHGIRVNVVNPDAVLKGSRIWQGDWLKERADAYGKDAAELAEHYRERSLLKREVLPEDIAEAIYFLVSDASSKSTGNILNVDAGNKESFTR